MNRAPPPPPWRELQLAGAAFMPTLGRRAEGAPLHTAVQYGAAHGALAMTTPGDTTMASKAEVLKLARGGGARVER